jgi:hypothetical protein
MTSKHHLPFLMLSYTARITFLVPLTGIIVLILLQWHHVPAPLFQTALRLQTILDTSSSLSEHSQEITALLLQ